MSGLNKIMVIGNVGTDPEMRYTPSGSPVTSFRLATSRRYSTQDGERREETEWFTIVAWSQLAEQVNQYLSKGRRAYVEGRPHSHSYQGNDGQMRLRNEIIAERVLFLDRAGGGEPQPGEAPQSGEAPSAASDAGAPAAGEPQAPEPTSADDLPF